MLPSDVETRNEAHSVAEVWVEQFNKWILADGQYGTIAELNGVPLNAVELQHALAEEQPVNCQVGDSVCGDWKRFILQNMYYFKIADDQRFYGGAFSKQLVLVPKGAPYPRKLAGGNEGIFANSVYISNPDAFYMPPK